MNLWLGYSLVIVLGLLAVAPLEYPVAGALVVLVASLALASLLAKDDCTLARAKRTKPKRLVELARSGDLQVRILVAGNRNTPPHALDYLCRDDIYNSLHTLLVITEAIQNPNIPTTTLARLCASPNQSIRGGACRILSRRPKREIIAATKAVLSKVT